MIKSCLSAAALALLVVGSAGAQPITPQPIHNHYLPGSVQPHINTPLTCNVDPAITNVNLTKMPDRTTVRVTVTIKNNGRDAWRSGSNQQNFTVDVHNNNTNHSVTQTVLLPANAAAGTTMITQSTPFIPNAFDNFEFGGYVDVRIGYDPDILLDSNICNDDANASNNHFRIEREQVMAFMAGAVTGQNFHP
jgi:hypothetical protein